MAFGAGLGAAVWARAEVAARVAGPDGAVVLLPGVDGAEGGGGQGGEDGGVVGDRVGDAFAADQAGADELVGVGSVDLRAGRAAGRASCLAGDSECAVRFVVGGVAVQEGAGERVAVVDSAAEVDGLGAAAGSADLGGPALVVRGRGAAGDVAERQR